MKKCMCCGLEAAELDGGMCSYCKECAIMEHEFMERENEEGNC